MDSITLKYFRLILLVAHDTLENLSTSQANDPTLTSLISRIRNPTTSNTRSVNYTAASRELRSLLESHGLLEEQQQQKQVLPNIAISEPPHSELYDGSVECPGHPARCRCCVCCRRRERRHREYVRRHNCRHPNPFNWHLFYDDYDNLELERNPERDQDERRLLHIADVRHWHRQDEIRPSQPLIRDQALGLALAIGKGREMHRRRAREERIRAEKEAALRRMRLDRMRSLAKVALPNQYVMSVRPRIRSHRQMRQFKRSRARHLAFMS
ncbi:hypothetical protein SI65_08412 [Aspergillus cristatus]|uniref:Uncharacterized protein n=1 Tax=Aspergillus cristatus TaxID=573508 RepID=A0A1E3B518_ASPCR|nr:hypothetical protein SI65_08412 [Aspergillus cristatus]